MCPSECSGSKRFITILFTRGLVTCVLSANLQTYSVIELPRWISSSWSSANGIQVSQKPVHNSQALFIFNPSEMPTALERDQLPPRYADVRFPGFLQEESSQSTTTNFKFSPCSDRQLGMYAYYCQPHDDDSKPKKKAPSPSSPSSA